MQSHSYKDDIHVLLLGRQGQVLWRTEGAFTPEKGDSLATEVRAWAHKS